MPEVLFYHLTRSPIEATLPELLEKTLARGWKALVRGGDRKRLDWLDGKLWAGDTGFLPHGLAGGPHDADQPVLLTTGADAPNRADILFAIDRAEVSVAEAQGFQRVCILFDGNANSAVEFARGQWSALAGAGLPSKYWSQESGSWQVKASKNIAPPASA